MRFFTLSAALLAISSPLVQVAAQQQQPGPSTRFVSSLRPSATPHTSQQSVAVPSSAAQLSSSLSSSPSPSPSTSSIANSTAPANSTQADLTPHLETKVDATFGILGGFTSLVAHSGADLATAGAVLVLSGLPTTLWGARNRWYRSVSAFSKTLQLTRGVKGQASLSWASSRAR